MVLTLMYHYFDTKNGGNFVFKGGANVDFSIEDGANETFNINTLTGDITAGGNLDAGILRLRDNVIQNNSVALPVLSVKF